jgi:hypothetical protein
LRPKLPGSSRPPDLPNASGAAFVPLFVPHSHMLRMLAIEGVWSPRQFTPTGRRIRRNSSPTRRIRLSAGFLCTWILVHGSSCKPHP